MDFGFSLAALPGRSNGPDLALRHSGSLSAPCLLRVLIRLRTEFTKRRAPKAAVDEDVAMVELVAHLCHSGSKSVLFVQLFTCLRRDMDGGQGEL